MYFIMIRVLTICALLIMAISGCSPSSDSKTAIISNPQSSIPVSNTNNNTAELSPDPWVVALNSDLKTKECSWKNTSKLKWWSWLRLLNTTFEKQKSSANFILYGSQEQKLRNRVLSLDEGKGSLKDFLDSIAAALDLRYDFIEGAIVFRDRQNPFPVKAVSSLASHQELKRRSPGVRQIKQWRCHPCSKLIDGFAERASIKKEDIRKGTDYNFPFGPEFGSITDIKSMPDYQAFEWSCRLFGIRYEFRGDKLYIDHNDTWIQRTDTEPNSNRYFGPL